MTCPSCGTELGPARKSCPACHALVHADRLRQLAAEADRLTAQGEIRAALAAWREALDLLPPEAGQARQVAARIDELSRRPEAALPQGSPEAAGAGRTGSSVRGWKGGGLLGGLAFLAWKLKTVLLLVLTKGKLLLLGLGNAGTLFSMSLSMGLYWSIFGWRLAALLLLSIYVHEMGHVAALRRIGLKASAPMFIPGFGAVVLLKQHPASPREDALVGLAGPIWGTGAALAAYLGAVALGSPLLAATALWGAWVNLFNLVPVWQLDGGRAFRALARGQRAAAAATLFAAGWLTGDPLAYVLGAVAAFRAFQADAPKEGDRAAFLKYLALVGALAAIWKLAQPLTKVAGMALP